MGGENKSQPNIILIVIAVYMLLIVFVALFGCVSSYVVNAVTFDFNGINQECVLGASSWMFSVGGFFIGIAGVLLDFSIIRTVIEVGSYIGKGGLFAEGIRAGWEAFRNIANLAIIAGLIWAAFSLILRIDLGGQNPGRLVVNVLIVALLINFSYFFAGAIIDASNFSSKLIYEQAISGEAFSSGSDVLGVQLPDSASISKRFMSVTRLGTIYDLKSAVDEGVKVNALNVFILALVGTILFGVAAAVFIFVTMLFFRRIVVIVILMFLAPIGMLRFTNLPTVSEWGKQWWKTLFAQAIFPPIFFVLIGISLKILETSGQRVDAALVGTGSLPGLLGESAGTINSPTPFLESIDIIFVYIIAMGLLVASAIVARNISQELDVKLPNSKSVFDGISQGFQGGIGVVRQGYSMGTKRFRIPFTDRTASLFSATGQALTLGQGGKAVRGVRDRFSGTGDFFLGPEGRAQKEAEKKRSEDLINRLGNSIDDYIDDPTKDKKDIVENSVKSLNEEQMEDLVKSLTPDQIAALREAAPEKREDIDKAVQATQGERRAEREAVDVDKLLAEMKGMRKDARVQSMREHRRDLRQLTQDREGVQRLKKELGEGSLGELPVDLISDAVIKEFDQHDLATLAGRDDVSDEQYEQIKERMKVSQERKVVAEVEAHESSPGSLPRKEGGSEDDEDGGDGGGSES